MAGSQGAVAPPPGDPPPHDVHRYDVSPEQVWQPRRPIPLERPGLIRGSILSPVLAVVGVSALILYGLLGLAGLAWILLH